MSSRNLIASICPEHEQATVRERVRQAGKSLERRVVRPVEIVEDNRRRRGCSEGLECEPDRFEERADIALARRGRTELGEQKCKLRCQLLDARTCLRPASEPVAQRCDKWSVRRRHPLDGEPPQNGNPAAVESLVNEARLSDAGLAGHEQETSAPARRCANRRLEFGQLAGATDQSLSPVALPPRGRRRANGEQPPLARASLPGPQAAIVELKPPAGDDVSNRARDEHLSGAGGRGDPRTD